MIQVRAPTRARFALSAAPAEIHAAALGAWMAA